MENQEENWEPPSRRTRSATKAIEVAKKVEEERIFNDFPNVMMVGYKVNDERRCLLDAIERGECVGGDLTIKEEVVEEEEERPKERRQEPDPLLQQGVKLEGGNVSIKEEVSEGEEVMMLEANLMGTMLAEGQAVAISIDFFQELELKEEGQWLSGGVVEGEGTEQEPILLYDNEDEAEAGNEVVSEKERDQVIKALLKWEASHLKAAKMSYWYKIRKSPDIQ